jgi:anaerobic magnesium-protoporphyrin IX monomethyl ester cyclase
MKITLISPALSAEYPQPPLGLASIAAVLEQAGHAVELLDANALGLSPAEAAARVRDADLVGLTAVTPTIGAAIATARYLKQAGPDRPVVLGGAHGTLLPEETMRAAPDIDVILRGEGEGSVAALVEALAQGFPLDGIPGLTFRRGGAVRHNPPSGEMVAMDALPFAAYHLLAGYRYNPHPPHGLRRPFMAVVTSRGCPYGCAYCSKPVFGNRFRARSPERVIEELAYLHRTLGIREVAFYDDVFTLDQSRAAEIAERIIASGLKLAWTCETRVNLVSEDLLRLMKRAGCFAIAYGLESASPDILERLHKGISRDQVVQAVRQTREAGIETIGYLMLGSPGETPETIRQTIALARELKLDYAQFSVTTPFPCTELYEEYRKANPEPVGWERFTYAGAEGEGQPVFESDVLTRRELFAWVRKAYRQFYLRPGYIWRRLLRLRDFSTLRANVRGLLMLFKSVVS